MKAWICSKQLLGCKSCVSNLDQPMCPHCRSEDYSVIEFSIFKTVINYRSTVLISCSKMGNHVHHHFSFWSICNLWPKQSALFGIGFSLAVDVLFCAVYHRYTIDKQAPSLFSAIATLYLCLTYPIIILCPYAGPA